MSAEASTEIYNVCIPPEGEILEPPLALAVLRDVAVGVVALALGLGLAAWAANLGSALVSGIVAVVCFIAAYVAALPLHEWGHYLGARLTGARAPRTPLRTAWPLFNFDIAKNSDRQFLAMSIGGNVALWLLALGLLVGLDGSNAGQLGLQAGALSSAISSVFGIEGYLIVNTLRWGRLRAWNTYLPHRPVWARASLLGGTVVSIPLVLLL